VRDGILECGEKVSKIADIKTAFAPMNENEFVKNAVVTEIDLGKGEAVVNVHLPEELYYKTLGELTGFMIDGEETLVGLLSELSQMKKSYDKIEKALNDVNESGYGIVIPDVSELILEEPETIKQNGGYGVRLKASGPSIHMIKANICTEISPIVGNETQSEELIQRMKTEFESSPEKLWQSNIFGKTLEELVSDGLVTKLSHMSEEARDRLGQTLEKVINEGSGGLICIIL
jgi:stage IV sporulation protein A